LKAAGEAIVFGRMLASPTDLQNKIVPQAQHYNGFFSSLNMLRNHLWNRFNILNLIATGSADLPVNQTGCD